MNAKRQTIWLVSMLSLMVVLSAYYLFTEDVNKLDLASTETVSKSQEVKIDMTQLDPVTGAKTDVKATNATTTQSDTKATTPQTSTKTDTKATTTQDSSKTTTKDATKTTTTTSKTDDQVLKQVEEQAKTTSANDYFTNEQVKQNNYFSKVSTDLMNIILDSKKTPEAVAKATNDLSALTDLQEKIENLQDMLIQDFPQAVINQDGSKWKVTVQADKLEKSQGVSIVDMVVKELGATPENIKIQYVRP
ncbi:SpoIIIAH-like family protein [Paenibacillus qinlingensis]|uniref:Stage III sporulation protein AH n=1 Tax=Paenibacillus qinlingensis TaxID=1837343 RepID=A0ABU1NR45_9BACL|nr:SpoIIIAH-like family protein [Paenibacillus qinlingensis]MDR6549352.1 stage III sporulation protein AH [Paenibacillus qinlingensis]